MENESNKELSLVYVKLLGENGNGVNEYELFFSETPDIVWAEEWAEQCPAAIGDIPPEENTISTIKKVVTPYTFKMAQGNPCYSMQDCIDGVISLCWCIDGDSDELLFKIKFGESLQNVKEILKKIDVGFE